MDGDIQVAEQLAKEAEQCLASLARKMQLYQSKFDIFQKQEALAEKEERELLQCIKELKDLELVYNRESEDAHKKLVQKGVQFQELTSQASELLSERALQLETAQLRALIGELQAEETRLSQETGPFPAWDPAAVPSLLAKSRALKQTFQELAAEHQQVDRPAVPAAAHVGAHNIVGDPQVAAAEVTALSAPPRQNRESDSCGADCARL
ncbi:uncharacterized protein LOC117652218 [Thrips palmi]|uniref:Uncharacterized protein LOC117652218 n=1 Tax=Thrips palmi TaxID=161013 RepID=A0A6P9A6H9_THRPL|nr:uncharacterized protein LOC117652218 [Thrips palmi]